MENLLKIVPGTGFFRWILFWRALFLGLILISAVSAQAGLTKIIRKINTDTLTWRVHVVDKLGRVIPAPTVLRLIPNGNDQENVGLMQRIARRYAGDADFLKKNVHPSLLVDYGDTDGIFVDTDVLNYHKKPEVVTIYAAIKRGYVPTIISDVARKNTTRDITIVLEPDNSVRVDDRMLEFDLIRASAYISATTGAERMQESRRKILLHANQQLRHLAQRLEQEDQMDMASAVYYSLAYLPSVDVIRQANGSDVIVGFTNGYTPDNPQRKADWMRAAELNRSNPNMLIEIFCKNLGIWEKNYLQFSSSERKAYIEYVEKMIKQTGERIWPEIVHSLIYQYQGEGRFVEACSALNRSYEFEPTFHDDVAWMKLLSRLNHEAGRAGDQSKVCQIAGHT